MAGDRVCPTTSGLANDRCTLQIFQIVGEFLGAGEGSFSRQYEYGFCAETLSGHILVVQNSSVLFSFPIVEVIEVSAVVEKVT